MPERQVPQPSRQPLILLAEDNETNILTIVDYLEALGFRIQVARNGVEALTYTREEHPTLILMDIQMPKMDGLETTRQIRTDNQIAHIPIIALTALAMKGDREQCLEAGANAYMSKPIRLKELSQVIDQLIGLPL